MHGIVGGDCFYVGKGMARRPGRRHGACAGGMWSGEQVAAPGPVRRAGPPCGRCNEAQGERRRHAVADVVCCLAGAYEVGGVESPADCAVFVWAEDGFVSVCV